MKVHQIDLKVYLLQDIKLDEMLSVITAFVDCAMASDESMMRLHQQKTYKPYVISGFKELEADKIYRAGKVCSFSLRTIDENLKDILPEKLVNVTTAELKGLTISTIYIPPIQLEKIYTITPAILKTDSKGYWKDKISLEKYEQYLQENAIKKYKYFSGENLEENFKLYYQIQFLNRKPIATNYKSIHFLGDKLELTLTENEKTQKIAYCLLGTGILNNGSRGYGYLNYKAVQRSI